MSMSSTLLRPATRTGESLVPMMKNVAKISHILYDTCPDFVALIPFGSRTKGLAHDDSDLDLFLIFEEAYTQPIIDAKIIIRDMLLELYPDLDVQIISRSRIQYEEEIITGGVGTHEVNLSYFGTILGPHRLYQTHQEIRALPFRKREEILRTLLQKAGRNELSHFLRNHGYDESWVQDHLRKRISLWKKRFKIILGL